MIAIFKNQIMPAIFPTENSSTEWVFFSTRMHCVQYVYHTLTQTQFNHQCQWCSCKIYIFSETLCHFTNSSEKLKSRTHMHRNWDFNDKIIEVYGQCFLIDFGIYDFFCLVVTKIVVTEWFTITMPLERKWFHMLYCIETGCVYT